MEKHLSRGTVSKVTYFTLGTGVAAGLAGGLSEIAWIGLYQHLSGASGAAVASGVAQSLLPNLAYGSNAVVLGIGIHLAISIVLGLSIALFIRRFFPALVGTLLEPLFVVASLVAIWGMNFFIVLPIINPAFVTIVPLAASLISKTLFGLASAFVLFWGDRISSQSQSGRKEISARL